MKHRLSVCILYGFCEGPKVGSKFERALASAGYTITRNAQGADIIFAHSTGCHIVPTSRDFASVFLVGLPFTKQADFIPAFLQNIWYGFKSHAYNRSIRTWAVISFWNLVYLWQIPHDIRTAHGLATDSWSKLRKVKLVCNRYDAICKPHLLYTSFEYPPAAIELPGYHGDCWFNPEPYVQLITAFSEPD